MWGVMEDFPEEVRFGLSLWGWVGMSEVRKLGRDAPEHAKHRGKTSKSMFGE